MRSAGTRVVLRDIRRDSDDEDLFHWLNLEEWKYYDEPDKPFIGTSREEFNKQLEERRRRPSPNSHGWGIDTTEGQHITSRWRRRGCAAIKPRAVGQLNWSLGAPQLGPIASQAEDTP